MLLSPLLPVAPTLHREGPLQTCRSGCSWGGHLAAPPCEAQRSGALETLWVWLSSSWSRTPLYPSPTPPCSPHSPSVCRGQADGAPPDSGQQGGAHEWQPGCALPEQRGPVCRERRPLAESQERHTHPGRGLGCGLCWPRSSTWTSSCSVQAASGRRSQLGWGVVGRAEQPGPWDSQVPPQDSSVRCPPVTGPIRKSVLESQWLLGLPALAAPTCAPTTAHSLKAPGTRAQVGNRGSVQGHASREWDSGDRGEAGAWVGQPSIHSIQHRAQRPWNPGPGGLG